jgi:hypothetical protein
LAPNSALTKLDYCANSFDLIGYALSKNTCLQELDISKCSLEPRAHEFLAGIVRINSTLQKLAARDTHITDESVGLIGAALHDNSTFRELEL